MSRASYIVSLVFLKTISLQELISLGPSFSMILKNRDNQLLRDKIYLRYTYNLSNDINEVEYQRILMLADELAIERAKINGDYAPSIFDVLRNTLHQINSGNDDNEKYDSLYWKELQSAFGRDFMIAIVSIEKGKEVLKKGIYGLLKNPTVNAKDGLSENHAHLYATGPIFPIIWNSVMCNPKSMELALKSSGIIERRLSSYSSYNDVTGPIAMLDQIKLAALIRFYLNAIISNRQTGSFYSRLDRALSSSRISILEVNQLFIDLDSEFSFSRLDEVELFSRSPDSYKKFEYEYQETEFLYSLLERIFSNNSNPVQVHLFHIYVSIKLSFRAEVLQENLKTGFSNFQLYQKRKQYFITGNDQKYYLHKTFEGYLHHHSFESRISPTKKLDSLIHSIKVCYSSLLSSYEIGSKAKFFHVLHFLKKSESNSTGEYPRNYLLRRKVAKESNYIIQYLNGCVDSSSVLGIDAASSELDCRAELFGPAFRYLGSSAWKNLPNFQLYKTYHIGEEFSDLVDGLRAIYEAIEFLELNYHEEKKKSDRLGHALAAGLDVDKWYARKNYIVRKTKQDHLDDLAFMIFVLMNNGRLELTNWLLNEFLTNYQGLFGDKSEGESLIIWEKYWKAFQLRGDCPDFLFKKSPEIYEASGGFWNNCFLREFKDCFNIRGDNEILNLYKRYHYDEELKVRGSKYFEYFISPDYISVVRICQEFLIKMIYDRKLAIEANPTSNRKIALVGDYEDHPVFKWAGKDADSTLNVSINTDDAGIFDTDLELEHNLIYQAALKKGYTEQEANDFLARLINNGRSQVFADNL
jgi:hypothetical protein